MLTVTLKTQLQEFEAFLFTELIYSRQQIIELLSNCVEAIIGWSGCGIWRGASYDDRCQDQGHRHYHHSTHTLIM